MPITLKEYEVDELIDTIREAIYVISEGVDDTVIDIDDDPLIVSLKQALVILGDMDE
jgi:hypothetical protein